MVDPEPVVKPVPEVIERDTDLARRITETGIEILATMLDGMIDILTFDD